MRVCHGLMTHPLILCGFFKGKEAYLEFYVWEWAYTMI